MAAIESVPPILNFEAIMQPVSEDKPSGESLQYSGLYDEIRESRRADENLAQGQWQTELKIADYRHVIRIAIPALETQTKDLQIGVWLSESLVKEHGFAGLRDALKLLNGLQETFWETMFPEIDEGDMEGRANALEWMDVQTAFAIKEAKITGGEGYGYFDYEDSKKFDIPENIDTLDTIDQQKYRELSAQAEKENRVTADKWRKARNASRRAFYEQLSFDLEECFAEHKELNRIAEEKFDRNQVPGTSNLKKALDGIQVLVKRLLEEKRAEEPDAVDETPAETEPGENGTGVPVAGGQTVAVAAGAIQNRKDALKRLAELAEFFRKTEPHSPLSYLIQRAVKWGEMPLESWLQDVIKDEAVLFQLRQTLGFNTNAVAAPGGGAGAVDTSGAVVYE
ncbi:MAG: type VI secretion system protein TssA [Pyrinomonadaceae bacterium]|nr:type VI secretion system protein TssA [Pyrinomonadaceae bacterium]